MSDRYLREFNKRCMRKRCAELGITVPENANIRQLKVALDTYNENAVVVHVEDGIDFRQTDKPTAEYTIHFTLYCAHTIRAESEEAACKWMEKNAADYYKPEIGELADMGDYELIAVYTDEDED